MQTWDTRSLDIEPHHPQVLHSDSEGRTIVINLPAGEELQQHQVHERSWVFVVDGDVELNAGDGAIQGGGGLLAHIDPNEPNQIRAISDTRLVMILAPWPGEGHPSR